MAIAAHWLKSWRDAPLVKVFAIVISAVTVSAGVVRYVDQQVAEADKHELTAVYEGRLTAMKSDHVVEVASLHDNTTNLQRTNGNLQSTLDSEHSRIVFTIERETNSLDRRTLQIPQERLPEDYKIVASEGFAVPLMTRQSSWQWREDTEHIVQPSDGDIAARLNLLFPKPVDLSKVPDAIKLVDGIKVSAFVDPKPFLVVVNGKMTTIAPQVTFELFRWSDFDKLASIGINAAAASAVDFLQAASDRVAGNLKFGSTGWASALNASLRPLDKPLDPKVTEALTKFTASDLATMLMAADPKVADDVVAAYSARVPGDKALALKALVEEQRQRWTELTRVRQRAPMPVVQLHASPDQAYLQIFVRILSTYLTIGSVGSPPPISPEFNELGFGRDYFVIRGYLPIPQPDSGGMVKVFFLNIGIRSDRGVYLIRYQIPGSGSLTDIRNAQSMVHGFHIIE